MLDGPRPSVPTLFAWDVLPTDRAGACGVTADQGAAVRNLAAALHDTGGHRGQVRTCRPSMAGDGAYVYLREVAHATLLDGTGIVWTTA